MRLQIDFDIGRKDRGPRREDGFSGRKESARRREGGGLSPGIRLKSRALRPRGSLEA